MKILYLLFATLVPLALGNYDYGDGYSANVQSNYGVDYDYAVPFPAPSSSTTKKADVQIMCYSCTYILEDGYHQGMNNCYIPFVAKGVPRVVCTGPCAATYRMLDKVTRASFMIVRDCRPNCREEDGEEKFTKCCDGNLCNHFMSVATPATKYSLLATTIACAHLVRLLTEYGTMS